MRFSFPSYKTCKFSSQTFPVLAPFLNTRNMLLSFLFLVLAGWVSHGFHPPSWFLPSPATWSCLALSLFLHVPLKPIWVSATTCTCELQSSPVLSWVVFPSLHFCSWWVSTLASLAKQAVLATLEFRRKVWVGFKKFIEKRSEKIKLGVGAWPKG